MSTLSSYIKEGKALLMGDKDEAILAKNERKGKNAFDSQIAALRTKLVDDESAIEDAEDELKKAYWPKEVISDSKAYVSLIVRREDELERAKEEKKATEASILKYENIIKSKFGA